MTIAAQPDPVLSARSLRAWYAELYRRDRAMTSIASAHAGLFVLFGILALGDSTEVMGVNQWLKPMKFAVSISIYLATLAWVTPVLGHSVSRRAAYFLIGATMILEMIWIGLQGARGVRSHFNTATPFDGAMFGAAGFAIAVNTFALAWLGVLALRAWRARADSYRLGIVLGIVLALASSAVGGYMISSHGHAVGVADGGAGLPFVNWSTAGGDLRVAHFVGLHALQALPFVGWRFGGRALGLMAAGWGVLTAGLLLQAMGGKPVWG